MPCGVKEREKMFLMESFSGKQSASRRETFTCISWDREVGIFLKKATALSLPGDTRGGSGLSRTEQCAGTLQPAAGSSPL